jgi:LacI family transcriptional regulator
MTTIIELAKKVGVSKTTISRFLNNEAAGHISAETQKKIMEAIEELNYHPNDLVRSLKRKKTNVIGVLVNDISNPFFTQMIKGIDSELQKAGYNMMVCSSNMDIEREMNILKMLEQKQMDGILVIGINLPTEHIEHLKIKTPIVLLERATVNSEMDCFIIDNIEGVDIAIKHLVNKGYKRIAHMKGTEASEISNERYHAYITSMLKYGREVNPQYIVCGNYEINDAYKAMAKLMQLGNPPDAVFCSNDLMAIGAIQYLQEKNYRIPEDIAVVGYDDIQMASIVSPRLTTIKQPILKLSIDGTKTLLQRIKEKDDDCQIKAIENVALKPEIIIRQSS